MIVIFEKIIDFKVFYGKIKSEICEGISISTINFIILYWEFLVVKKRVKQTLPISWIYKKKKNLTSNWKIVISTLILYVFEQFLKVSQQFFSSLVNRTD